MIVSCFLCLFFCCIFSGVLSGFCVLFSGSFCFLFAVLIIFFVVSLVFLSLLYGSLSLSRLIGLTGVLFQSLFRLVCLSFPLLLGFCLYNRSDVYSIHLVSLSVLLLLCRSFLVAGVVLILLMAF